MQCIHVYFSTIDYEKDLQFVLQEWSKKKMIEENVACFCIRSNVLGSNWLGHKVMQVNDLGFLQNCPNIGYVVGIC